MFQIIIATPFLESVISSPGIMGTFQTKSSIC